jgi:hypothetical protein
VIIPGHPHDGPATAADDEFSLLDMDMLRLLTPLMTVIAPVQSSP